MKRRSRTRQGLLVFLGLLCVSLGTLGIVVPLLPTTPFLLLAASCFLRSSERRYHWLMNHPWFGTYLRNYSEHRAITARARLVAIILLWSTIGYSASMVASSWVLRGFLFLVATGVTAHLLLLRTMPTRPPAAPQPLSTGPLPSHRSDPSCPRVHPAGPTTKGVTP